MRHQKRAAGCWRELGSDAESRRYRQQAATNKKTRHYAKFGEPPLDRKRLSGSLQGHVRLAAGQRCVVPAATSFEPAHSQFPFRYGFVGGVKTANECQSLTIAESDQRRRLGAIRRSRRLSVLANGRRSRYPYRQGQDWGIRLSNCARLFARVGSRCGFRYSGIGWECEHPLLTKEVWS